MNKIRNMDYNSLVINIFRDANKKHYVTVMHPNTKHIIHHAYVFSSEAKAISYGMGWIDCNQASN